MNKFLLSSVLSIVIILSTAPIANAMFLAPVEIIDFTGDGGGNSLSTTRGIATDSTGNVFVTGFSTSNAFKITPGGTITEIIDSLGDGGGNVLAGTTGIATDSAGNVFVTGFLTNNVFKITPGGTITEIIDTTGDGGGNTLFNPWGVTTDSAGNVFVVGLSSGNAFKISTPGTCSTSGTICTITEIIDATGDGGGNTLLAPRAIATDSAGNVFVSGDSGNVFKITPGGTITEIIDTTGDGGGNTFTSPRGVATDSAGNVFVSGFTSDNAFKISTPGTCSTSGTICTITEIIDTTAGPGIEILDGSWGVATDSAGNVFVVGFVSSNAFKISTPGTCSTSGTICTITEIIDNTGDGGVNTLVNSIELALDSLGNVFVAGQNSANAFKLELEVSSSGIGGKIIPIESTSLILAGAQSFSWMIPVVLSVLGIGIFVVSRRA